MGPSVGGLSRQIQLGPNTLLTAWVSHSAGSLLCGDQGHTLEASQGDRNAPKIPTNSNSNTLNSLQDPTCPQWRSVHHIWRGLQPPPSTAPPLLPATNPSFRDHSARGQEARLVQSSLKAGGKVSVHVGNYISRESHIL